MIQGKLEVPSSKLLEKRREDARALQKLRKTRIWRSHTFRTKCFWSAVSLRTALHLKAKSRPVNYHLSRLAKVHRALGR